MPLITADIIIIGGGIHGCSAALHLAMRGVKVLVIEKNRVGRHASSANAGGVRRLGRALPEIPLSVASAEMWQNMEDLVDDDCGFVSSYQIKLALTNAQFDQLHTRVGEVCAIGFEHEEIIDQKTLRELAPVVSPECIGAIVVYGDGFANPFQTMHAFHRKCQRFGVDFYEGNCVEKIERTNNSWAVYTNQNVFAAQSIVNCAGAWGGQVAGMLGDELPVTAEAPMLMISDRMPPFFDGVAGAQGTPLSFKQFPNGTVLIGGGHVGTADAANDKAELTLEGLAGYAATAQRYFPIMANAKIVRCWAGIEGFMPDGIPVIGRGGAENVFHSLGYSAHGYQMGPICGKIVSELVLDGVSALPIDAFSAERFSAV